MKQVIFKFFSPVFIILLLSFSTKPVTNGKHEPKSLDNEIGLEVERGRGEVMLHIYAKDLSQYENIIVERNTGESGFSQCKLIDLTTEKVEDIGYIMKVDRYPTTAKKDAYYRLKTVSKDGVTKSYPSVLMSASGQ